ncbi:MAG: hypothetical protein M3M99_02030 [Actinomycetota bacterium]|nr:hypothetical protein [Actinomycetota bacterium]
MNFARLRQGEIIAALGGVALFSVMFLPWFGRGIDLPPGAGDGDADLSAWDALQSFDGYLLALTALAGVVLGGLAAAGQRLNLGGLPRGSVTAVLGSVSVTIILWRLLANPADLKYGIFLGLAAAIAVAVGAILALRDDGFEPLLGVAGVAPRRAPAKPRAAASSPASAPPTVPNPLTGSASAGSRTPARTKSSTSRAKSSGSRAKGSSSDAKSAGGAATKKATSRAKPGRSAGPSTGSRKSS